MRMTISRTRTARPARPISSGSVMRSSLRLQEALDQGDAGSERQQGEREQDRDESHPVGKLPERRCEAVGLLIELAEGAATQQTHEIGQYDQRRQQSHAGETARYRPGSADDGGRGGNGERGGGQ